MLQLKYRSYSSADVSAFLEKSLTKQGIKILTGAGVESITTSAAGVKGAAFGIAVSAPVVAAAHFLSPMFRSFSVSTKTGLIVTPFFGFFFLNSELAMNACAQKRKAYAAAVRA